MIGSITDVTLGYVPPKSIMSMCEKHFKTNENYFQEQALFVEIKKVWHPIIHCHTIIGDDNFKVIGGHMQDAKVAIKVEVIIDVLNDKQIYQVIDSKSNFHVWDI